MCPCLLPYTSWWQCPGLVKCIDLLALLLSLLLLLLLLLLHIHP
jgi:hypothetical protein